MKLMPASWAAAALLGISALIHPTVSFALPPCSICARWYAECQKNPRSSACNNWNSLCQGCPPDATFSDMPPNTHNDTSNAALLNLRRGDVSARGLIET